MCLRAFSDYRPARLSRWLAGGCSGTTPWRLGRWCRRRAGGAASRLCSDQM